MFVYKKGSLELKQGLDFYAGLEKGIELCDHTFENILHILILLVLIAIFGKLNDKQF